MSVHHLPARPEFSIVFASAKEMADYTIIKDAQREALWRSGLYSGMALVLGVEVILLLVLL
jgi:hypothetical protein